jgi:pyoverdine/dityrosine biosynthesis protein Dit1
MQHTAEMILDVFQHIRMQPTPIDQYDSVGKDILRSRIEQFVSNNKTIEFVMLGYPMKSANTRDKVLGVLPDLAEQASIENFAQFNEVVKQFYAPGVRINVVNDGYVFNDLLKVFDNTVREYEDVTVDMAQRHGAPVQIYDLTHFYNVGRLGEMREKLMAQFGISDLELDKRINFDPDVNYLYRGMIRFMEEELAINTYDSRNQRNKAAKALTRQMMLRNEAYSGLVAKEFSSYIRLSMHPSVNNGGKYSIQLIPGNPKNIHHSPWHCAVVLGEDGYETIHRKDAINRGYELRYRDGRPYYFVK